MPLKRFYDHVNRPFDCILGVGCQRSIPLLQMVHVLSLIAMIAMKTHHCLSRYFLTCEVQSSNCHQPFDPSSIRVYEMSPKNRTYIYIAKLIWIH